MFVSPREISFGGGVSSEDDEPEDRFASMGEELPVYVFRQIAPDLADVFKISNAILVKYNPPDG